MTFRDKHILITGGSSGIGLALARRSAVLGARVSLVARDRARLSAAGDSVRAAAPSARVATANADVSVRAEAERALESCVAQNGPVDILITSAGIARPGYFEEVPVEVFERTMAVNYLGTLYMAKLVVPAMRQRGGGWVVVISSGAAIVGLFGYTPYSPTKFALRGLAESLRAELAPASVGVSIVYPPDTDTPQLAEENLTKPLETKAITAGAGLWTADEVARVTLDGVARGRFAITPGLPLTALWWTHSLLAPVLRWWFDRAAAKARAGSGGS